MGRSALTAYAAATAICRRLAEAGHVAYLAGGCVRDRLLGREPTDYDVATDARPPRVRELFRGSRGVGEAFGVVLVPMGPAATEVATFRSEWGYRDGRRPDRVEFTDAEHDARRRDFTINGLFEDPLEDRGQEAQGPRGQGLGTQAGSSSGGCGADNASKPAAPTPPAPGPLGPSAPLGKVIDFVGGVADLRASVVRAIGDADHRFAEDDLRMLRAVRFAARLGFELDSATAEAIVPRAGNLARISRERIGAEIRGMLTGPDPARAAALIQRLELDGPALDENHVAPDLPTLRALTGADPKPRSPAPAEREAPRAHVTYPLALAAWLLDRHAPAERAAPGLQRLAEGELPAIVSRWRKALRLTNDQRDRLGQIIERLPKAMAWDGLDKAGRKRLLGHDAWPEVWALLGAVGGAALVRAIEADAADLAAEGVAPAPLLTGADLIALGLEPGPAFKHLLRAVYDQQLAGHLATRDQALAWVRGRRGSRDES